MTADVKVTIEVTLADLLAMTVDRGYEDYDSDVHGVTTVATLVADEIASRVTAERQLWLALQKSVDVKVSELVNAALDKPPSSTTTLHQMIVAEANEQLRPNPDTYKGTATPLAQYLASLVYKAIREEAVNAVAKIQAQVDQVVQAEIKRQLEQIALAAARAFTP